MDINPILQINQSVNFQQGSSLRIQSGCVCVRGVVHFPRLGRARSNLTRRGSAPTAPSPWPTSTNVTLIYLQQPIRSSTHCQIFFRPGLHRPIGKRIRNSFQFSRLTLIIFRCVIIIIYTLITLCNLLIDRIRLMQLCTIFKQIISYRCYCTFLQLLLF